MEIKGSNLMFGLVISIGVFIVFFAFSGKMFSNYGTTVPTQYETTFSKMENMTEVTDNIQELKSSALNENDAPKSKLQEATDIIGKYFERGLKTLMLLPKGADILISMINVVLDSQTFLGSALKALRFIVIALIVLGIAIYIVNQVTGRNL